MKLFLSVFALLLLMQFDRNESNAQRVNDSKKAPWIDSRLQEAGENSIELKKALDEIEVEFRPGLDFLISNMPESDLKSLDADFLLEHVRGAYLAWQKSPWHSQVSQEAFFQPHFALLLCKRETRSVAERFSQTFSSHGRKRKISIRSRCHIEPKDLPNAGCQIFDKTQTSRPEPV